MEEGDCDTGSCCTDTSRWSSPCCGSDGPESDHEERDDRTPDEQPSAKPQGSKKSGYNKGTQKQKMKCEILKLPPIRPPQGSKPLIQSANTNCIWALKSQVWDLQQQLSEAKTENKLLKKAQQRHMVTQRRFSDPEDRFHQILAKHENENKALQSLLRETRLCRDNLDRRLQATERKLLSTKDALHHLQRLTQDQSLLKREELTLRLARATTQLQDNDRRIQNMERGLELQREAFKRQTDLEQRKVRGERNTNIRLQEEIHQLTKEIQALEPLTRQVQNAASHQQKEA